MKRTRVRTSLGKNDTTKLLALFARALDEGRSFKLEMSGDRIVVELGARPQ